MGPGPANRLSAAAVTWACSLPCIALLPAHCMAVLCPPSLDRYGEKVRSMQAGSSDTYEELFT